MSASVASAPDTFRRRPRLYAGMALSGGAARNSEGRAPCPLLRPADADRGLGRPVRWRPWVLNGVTKLFFFSVGRLSSLPPGSTAARSGARVKTFSTRLAALRYAAKYERNGGRARVHAVGQKGNGAGRSCAVREEPRPKLPAPSSRGKPFVSSPNGPASRFSRGEAHTDFVEPGMRCAPSTRGKACVRPGRSRNCGHGGRPRMLRSTRGTAAPESTSARGTCRRAPSRRRARRRLPVGSLVRSKDVLAAVRRCGQTGSVATLVETPPRERRRGRALLKRTRGHATLHAPTTETRVGGGLLRAFGKALLDAGRKWRRHHGLTRGTCTSPAHSNALAARPLLASSFRPSTE